MDDYRSLNETLKTLDLEFHVNKVITLQDINHRDNDPKDCNLITKFPSYGNDSPFLLQYNSDPIMKIENYNLIKNYYELILSPCEYLSKIPTELNISDEINELDKQDGLEGTKESNRKFIGYEDLFRINPANIYIKNCNNTYDDEKCKIKYSGDKIPWCQQCHGDLTSREAIIEMLEPDINYTEIHENTIRCISRKRQIIDLKSLGRDEIETIILKFGSISDDIRETQYRIDHVDDEITEAIQRIMDKKIHNELRIKTYIDHLGQRPEDSIKYLFNILEERNHDELQQHDKKQQIMEQYEALLNKMLKIEAKHRSIREQKEQLDQDLYKLEPQLR